nr:SymE family type I addiction module toxin [Klebsiella variicola]
MEALWLWVGSASHRSCGNWLAEAGFSTDTPVMVSVEQRRLVIEPVRG